VGAARCLIAAGLLLAGCKQDQQQAGPPKVVADAGVGGTSPIAPRAAPAASSSTSEVERSVDLLHRTASVVVTSSHADGNSTGANLVDQLAETSWKPNPTDPAPWIEIDLPASAAVERIELTPASSSVPQPRLRATRVLVSKAEHGWVQVAMRESIAAQGELVLEPISPTAATRLRLSLTEPRIAELRVLGGIIRHEVLAPAIPETRVQGNPRIDYNGSLFAAWVLGAPYATDDALCRAFVHSPGVGLKDQQPLGELCRKLPDVTVAGAAPNELLAVQRYQLVVPDEISPAETTALVVRGEHGLYPANLALADTRNEGMCPGGPEGDMSVSNFRFEQGVLLLDRTRYFTPGILATGKPGVASASVLRCKLEGRLTCREFITRLGAPTLSLTDDGTISYRLPTTWSWTRTLTVTQRGSIRLTPCFSTGGKGSPPRIVPCAARGVELL
jgi:hypothetical protein